MARPTKQGLDYFPLDVDIWHDDRVLRLLRKHGAEGLAVWLGLLTHIYRVGFCYRFDAEIAEDVAFQLQISAETLQKVVENLSKKQLV